jgi:hypothetical protein
MKKTVLICLLVFVFSGIKAQVYFGFGYNLGFAKMKGLNAIVDNYNNTRSWLDNEMGYFKKPNGFVVNMGMYGNSGGFVELTWVGRNQTNFASGVAPATNINGQRDLKLRMNTVNMGFGFDFLYDEAIGFGIGGSIDFGKFKIMTRVADFDKIDQAEYADIIDEILIGSTIFAQFKIGSPALKLQIRPYYTFNWFETDITDVNETINSFTAGNDPSYAERGNNYGLISTLVIVLGL